MYHLTLTAGERKALDWVGARYAHGHDLYKLLWVESTATPDDADWDSEVDIAFAIPEHIAWRINDFAEECEHRWDCFSPDLAVKLNELCESIV